MRPAGTGFGASRYGRHSVLRWGIALTAAVVAGALIWVGASWALGRYRIGWSISRGLESLATVESPDEVLPRLAEWERKTGQYWRSRTDDLINRLYAHHDLKDPHVRRLLERVSGANYGDREDDWERWYKTRARLKDGKQPQGSVQLEPQWEAPIGLTAWFTTILPLEGRVYIASLGATTGDEDDPWDGVVCVDGVTGEATLIFEPPDRRPRDVVGLALADDGLFVAVRSGFVYLITPEGELVWRCFTVHRIVSVPLATDVNGDGVTDVIVATERGTVVAISGKTGKTPWVIELPDGPPSRQARPDIVQASLSAGHVLSRGTSEIVIVAETGQVYVVAARSGRLLWSGGLAGSGAYAGALTFFGGRDNETVALLGDGQARLWRLVRAGAGIDTHVLSDLARRSGDGIVADLRTLDNGEDVPAWVIACPTPLGGTGDSSVCAIDTAGLRWRYAPGGLIWAPPAVADIDGDRASELVITSVVPRSADGPGGLLTILSRDGHCLKRLPLPNAPECPPAIADITGDGRIEILIADTAGVLRCYAARGSKVEWGVAAGDAHNTRNTRNAYSWGQVPYRYQWRWRPEF